LIVEPSSVDNLLELAGQYDEPIADHSIIPTALVSRLVKRHVTVALGGDGGDELFGGYPHYNHLQKISYLRRFFPSSLRTQISKFATNILPTGFKGRNHLIGFAGDMSESIAHVNLYFDAACRRRILPMLRDRCCSAERHKASLCTAGHSPLQQATRVDFQTTMVDGYLVKVDRASMLYSLEVRAPFLDHRLIEYAYGRLPDTQRATVWNRKVLLRRMARRLLPPTFDLRRKQGFSLPLERWFKGRWGNYIEEVLNESGDGFYDRKAVDQLIAGQRRGHANMNRLFALAMFELWRRKYRIGI
jgi:asparagine synthase (glutamine-hydrolysing)